MNLNIKELLRGLFYSFVDSDGLGREHSNAAGEMRGDVEAKSQEEELDELRMREQAYHAHAKRLMEDGRSFHDVLRHASRLRLLKLKTQGVNEEVEVVTGCCDDCDEALSDEVLTIDEALKVEPIPHPECTRYDHIEEYQQGWCICMFQPVLN